MSSFDTKDSLLESVNSLFHSLNKGELSLNELETLVNQTRELYERAIVLRHKAYEKSVIKNLEPHILVPLEEAIETQIENIPEIISETIDKQENTTVKEFEQPTFDMSFSLFDELESESKPIEEVKEEVIITETVQMTETVVEPIIEPVVEIKEEIVAIVEPVLETVVTPESVKVVNQGPKDVFDKMLEVSDNSLGSQLMAKKLDSLNGAFGLNEKLQMTHELFNGSSESFYQAVQLFDTLDNFSQAKDVLNKFKEEFSWNLEASLVTEFVQKIARRYA
jgi:hypothetical protein